jgi:hypothetical protein
LVAAVNCELKSVTGELSPYMFKGKLKNQAYNKESEPISMLKKDGTIESLVENTSSLPYSRIEFEIDQFKGRLSNIGLPKYLEEEGRVFELIDELINMRKSTYTKEKLLGLLEALKKRLYELLTYYAKQYLQLHKLSR